VKRLVAATANPDKLAEVREILAGRFEVAPRPTWLGEVAETGGTLRENARLKAMAVAQAVGEAALADDTGLEVACLGGRPGVYSARYAGPQASYADNVSKLLAEMGDCSDRSARFRTVVCLCWPDGTELYGEGVVLGSIATEPLGQGGFGYDPVFVPDEADGRSFAQMTSPEKNRISHRARALWDLLSRLGQQMH
jgi:XTP/dITP diphosphohydrolase